jgi:hypothetical protein
LKEAAEFFVCYVLAIEPAVQRFASAVNGKRKRRFLGKMQQQCRAQITYIPPVEP